MTVHRSRLRVALLAHGTLGGSGVVARHLGAWLAAQGHEVHLLTSTPDEHAKPAGVQVHLLDAPAYPVFDATPTALAAASWLMVQHAKTPFDIVHAHYAVPWASSVWMARMALAAHARPFRWVTTLHGTDVTGVGESDAYRPVTLAALTTCDALTTPSASLRDQIRSRLGEGLAENCEVIENSVDIERFSALSETARQALRQRLLPEWAHEPWLVHVSNFRAVKAPWRLAPILAEVRRHRAARLILVGDGPERARVEAALAEHGVCAAVHWVDGAALPWMQAADVFVLPSQEESFGLASLESMACGVPVVASAVGGIPEVVRTGVTGWLCAPDDAEAFGQAIVAVCSGTPEARAMREQARAHATSHYAHDVILAQYLALYERLLSKESP